MTEDYYVGKLSLGDVKAKLNGTYVLLKQGDTDEFREYLSKRYIFTHDEESFYNKKPKCNEKHNFYKEED